MKYFTLEEMIKSPTAQLKGIRNSPSPAARVAIDALVNDLLDPIREAWGKPINVNSGYRSVELNKAINGSSTSQHCKGEAADITTGNPADNKKLFDLIKSKGFEFDQLIDEKKYSWIHISFKGFGRGNRQQILHL